MISGLRGWERFLLFSDCPQRETSIFWDRDGSIHKGVIFIPSSWRGGFMRGILQNRRVCTLTTAFRDIYHAAVSALNIFPARGKRKGVVLSWLNKKRAQQFLAPFSFPASRTVYSNLMLNSLISFPYCSKPDFKYCPNSCGPWYMTGWPMSFIALMNSGSSHTFLNRSAK